MASSEERQAVADRLDAEFDQYLQELLEKNKGFQYEGGFTEENLEEQLQSNPLFMTREPTAEEIEKNDLLQALQALKYGSEDPVSNANAYRDDGNVNFKAKKYRLAVKAYTEGIRCGCNDQGLNGFLYNNRAAAHFFLENYRLCLADCIMAIKLRPGYIKPVVRAAHCCLQLELPKDVLTFCENGFTLDPNNEALLVLKEKAQRMAAKQDDKANNKDLKNKFRAMKRLVSAIKKRGVILVDRDRGFNGSDSDSDQETDSEKNVHAEVQKLERLLTLSMQESHAPSSARVYLDSSNRLHWPVLLAYPEFGVVDFIQDFPEDLRFSEGLQQVFCQTLPWDEHQHYHMDTIHVLYEDRDKDVHVHIPLSTKLSHFLSSRRVKVFGGTPGFVIISMASPFYDSYISRYQIETF